MQNEQYKVSIIVAVFNVEKYLKRCLDSLQNQTYHNIEIVLVDDGSTDRSGLICDEYVAADSRFKVIHKDNGGVSKARQIGLDASFGDYVIHADPDDYVDSNMISELLLEAVDKDVDMVSCDFYLDGKYYKQGYSDEKDFLAKVINVGIISVCWNVFVKRSFIIEHDIRFTPEWLNQSEDFLFMARLLTAGATASHLNKAFYFYWSYNGNSLSNKRSKKKIESIIAVIDEMEKIVNPEDYDNLYIRKKYALLSIFNSRYFEKLNFYSEIHNRIIKEGQDCKYLAKALQGHVYIASLQSIVANLVDRLQKKIKYE